MAIPTTSSSGKLFEAKPTWTGQIGSGGVPDATTTTIPLASATGLTNGKAYIFTIDRVDASGNKTPAKKEVCIGELSGTNFINCVRGVEGTAQAHSSGAVVEVLFTATHWNKLLEMLDAEHNDDGTHKDINATTVTTTGDVSVGSAIKTDTISEKTAGSGINLSNKVITSKAVKPTYSSGSLSGSTITLDLNEANYFMITLGGSVTLAVTNATVGQHFIVRIKQDATGGHSVTWWSGISWAGGSVPSLTTTANKADVFGFTVTGSGTYDGFVVGQNI